ncbi:MAG: peptidase T [Deltaproteobacteria bacterium]|nr:peptidase T [Deltaproteobacteria bacterium]
MRLTGEVLDFIRRDALERFLRYVKIHTTSSEESGTNPSSKNQFELANLLREELLSIGVEAIVDEFCYLYATLPASDGVKSHPISFMAHLDTSPAVSGENVKPVIHKNYDGGEIRFVDDPNLVLSPKDSPELLEFVGQDIITASGTTLLGADDKAGIAIIMTMVAAFKKFPQLIHPEIRVCFTPDEEIGAGTAKIDISKLGKVCYTFDGGMIGEIENECFDAMGVKVRFIGLNVHPGYAKGKMINAAGIAARFYAMIPEYETPERTENREGFFHLLKMNGDESEATLQFIIRDFEHSRNEKRVELLRSLKDFFEKKYCGLKIDIEVKEQYRNFKEVLDKTPEVTEFAIRAIEMAGIKPIRKAIRGGTDGARLSFMGIPTPNVFAGGLLFHSKKEWIPVVAFEKAVEVGINICKLWAEKVCN